MDQSHPCRNLKPAAPAESAPPRRTGRNLTPEEARAVADWAFGPEFWPRLCALGRRTGHPKLKGNPVDPHSTG